MECIQGKTSTEIDADGLDAGVASHGEVLIDAGTGDGRYVLHVARTCPNWFAISVGACKDNLRRASHKAPPRRAVRHRHVVIDNQLRSNMLKKMNANGTGKELMRLTKPGSG